MIKKLKSSLTAKIFLLTVLLLVTCCIATYAFIAWLIPKTYPGQVDLEAMEMFAEHIKDEFQHTSYDDFKVIASDVEETARTKYGQKVELHIFDGSGVEIYGSGATKNTIDTYDKANRTSVQYTNITGSTESYSFFFLDNQKSINQALVAINKALPYLIVTVLVISIITALIYSRYITSPILMLSKASQKMIDMDFSLQGRSNRTDELGTVYNNLSILAQKLSLTLEELESANVQLQKDIKKERILERQRTEFFSAVSHELKTPITIVKGQLQGMISNVGRYKDRDTYLIKSLEVIGNLETMVQELLTVSRMDAPGFVCRREPLDLTLLIKICLTAHEDIFIQKNMKLSCDLPVTIPYLGDLQLLKRMFDNLIGNGLNYSPEQGEIIVSAHHEKEAITFSIENTGVHIDPDELPRLFDAFYRPDYSRNRQTGGSGLGLYIVKRILDLHHAQYSIENSKYGVIFSIHF